MAFRRCLMPSVNLNFCFRISPSKFSFTNIFSVSINIRAKQCDTLFAPTMVREIICLFFPADEGTSHLPIPTAPSLPVGEFNADWFRPIFNSSIFRNIFFLGPNLMIPILTRSSSVNVNNSAPDISFSIKHSFESCKSKDSSQAPTSSIDHNVTSENRRINLGKLRL